MVNRIDWNWNDIVVLPWKKIHNGASIKVEIASPDGIGVHRLRSIPYETSATVKGQRVETTHLC